MVSYIAQRRRERRESTDARVMNDNEFAISIYVLTSVGQVTSYTGMHCICWRKRREKLLTGSGSAAHMQSVTMTTDDVTLEVRGRGWPTCRWQFERLVKTAGAPQSAPSLASIEARRQQLKNLYTLWSIKTFIFGLGNRVPNDYKNVVLVGVVVIRYTIP